MNTGTSEARAGTAQAYTHNGDASRMLLLGLDTTFGSDWTDIGTVDLGAGRTIKVEVVATPAQFFRFTVARPGKVTLLVTNSGGFQDYYDVVERFARDGKLDGGRGVKRVRPENF
jgi:hypothetical protein